MSRILRSIFLVALVSLKVIEAQNCRGPWLTFRNCMKNRYNEFSNQRRLDEGARSGVVSRIRTCYKSRSCFDPFPNNDEMNARRDCYRQTKDQLKKPLLACVKAQFSDFEWPEDEDVVYAWHQDETYINSAELDGRVCPPSVSRLDVRQCTRDEISKTFSNNPSRTVCETRWDCIKQQNMDRTCFDRWEDLSQTLCKCTDQLNVQPIKDSYASCLSKRKFSVSGTDWFNQWIDNTRNRYCSGRIDALCSGFSGTDVNRLLGAFGNNNVTSLFGSLLGGKTGGGSSSGLSNLFSSSGGGAGGSSSTSNQLSQLANLFNGGSNQFGTLLGGRGPSYDFMHGRK